MIYIIGCNGYLGRSFMDHLEGAVGLGRADRLPLSFDTGDTIINCASHGWVSGQESVIECINSNIILPMEIEQRRNGACLIWFASGIQRERPGHIYSQTKNVTQQYLNGKAHIITLYTIYGGEHEPPHRFMGTFLRALKNGTPYVIANPQVTRDFVHINRLLDVVELLCQDKKYKNIDFGCGKVRSLREVYEHMAFLGVDVSKVVFQYPKYMTLEEYCAQSPYLPDYFEDDIKYEWDVICG